MKSDPRFTDQPSRSQNINALYEIVVGVMQTKTTADWLAILEEADVPVMPMNEPEDLFDCPHLSAVDMFPIVEHPTEGTIRHIKVPVAFSKTPGGYYRHPARLGESTASVLEEVGYSADDIAALQASGAAVKAKD